MVTAHNSNNKNSLKVPSVSLDFYFSDKSIEKINLIKIDIEGSEFPALQGMKETLNKFKPYLLIEINPNTPFGIESIDHFLLELGYKKRFIGKEGQVIDHKLDDDYSCNYLFI